MAQAATAIKEEIDPQVASELSSEVLVEEEEDRPRFADRKRRIAVVLGVAKKFRSRSDLVREHKDWIVVLRDVDFGVKQGFTGRQVGFDYVDGYGRGKHWQGLWSKFVIEFFGIGERQMRKLLGETSKPKPKPDPRNSKLYKQGWNDHAAQYGGSKLADNPTTSLCPHCGGTGKVAA